MTGDLQFVVLNGPRLPEDARLRALIRKKASKNIISPRRQRGDFSSSKISSVPRRTTVLPRNFIRNDAEDTNDLVRLDPGVASTGNSRAIWLNDDNICYTSNPSRSLQGPYENARARYQLDIVDLSILANFNVGRGTIAMLAGTATRLMSLIGHQHWSFLQYVPDRYASSDCIAAATNCLLAEVRSRLIPSRSLAMESMNLYSKAIKSLQRALEDTTLCLSADTLCASQLLSLRELLNPHTDIPWSRLQHGSTSLIRHRTPEQFTSDLDLALFAAHVGPSVFEPLIAHQHCYLAEPEWLKLYQSLARNSDNLDDRSPLAIQMRSQIFILPGLWHDLHDAVLNAPILSTTFESIEPYRTAHQNLLTWFAQYKAYCVRKSLAMPTTQELAKRREVLGIALECLAVTKRLLATVCVMESCSLEREAQELALQIMDLQTQPCPEYSWLFSGHEIGVAQSILMTKELWATDLTDRVDSEDRARERYLAWDGLLRNPDT